MTMPFVYDFSKAFTPVKTVDVRPDGWKPVTVEYVTGQPNIYDTMQSVCWRVKGTTHTFTIYERRLNQISHGDYAGHFKEALEGFRKDYNNWQSDPKYAGCGWVDEYVGQFSAFILPDGGDGGAGQ